MAGAWEPGLHPADLTKQQPNVYWHLWTWSPETGHEAVCWFHTARGGAGPDGKIQDFLWLPDGRLVVGGLSRDVLEMRWLDAARTQLLLCGAFEHANDWTPLNGVAVLDTTTGDLRPLGGGLLRASREQVIAPMVHHAVRGEELWFAGLFDHAGVNANSRLEAPVESANVAMWHPAANLDPNRGLTVAPVAALPANTGSGSQSHKVELAAELQGGQGTISWYERGSSGAWQKRGTGPKFAANARVPPGGGDLCHYVSVTGPDGVEGGKLPVRIPVGSR